MDGHGAFPGRKGSSSKSWPWEGLFTIRQQLPCIAPGQRSPPGGRHALCAFHRAPDVF